MNILSTQNLSMQFGGIKAVNNVSLDLPRHQISALIGPNGAGKTTFFNMLTGVYQPTSGTIIFDGKPLNISRPNQVAKLGMARTFQNIRLFKELSVLDNVKIATDLHSKNNIFSGFFQTRSYVTEQAAAHERALELLQTFGLADRAHSLAKNLPYGDQRRLEIVRALATNCHLLLLDEPAAGMNHSETHDLMETLRKILKQFSLTILLIEHDMKLVMGISESIYVLDHGELIASGKPNEIRSNDLVIKAYLGSSKKKPGQSTNLEAP